MCSIFREGLQAKAVFLQKYWQIFLHVGGLVSIFQEMYQMV